jgi:hypothetical protein
VIQLHHDSDSFIEVATAGGAETFVVEVIDAAHSFFDFSDW